MRFSSVFILGVQISSIVALPAHSVRRSQVDAASQPLLTRNIGAAPVSTLQQRSKEEDKAEAVEPAKVGTGKAAENAVPAKVEAGEAAKGAAKPAKIEAGKAANETAVGGGAKAGEEAAAGEEEKLAGGEQFSFFQISYDVFPSLHSPNHQLV